jgi:hypothetical protein
VRCCTAWSSNVRRRAAQSSSMAASARAAGGTPRHRPGRPPTRAGAASRSSASPPRAPGQRRSSVHSGQPSRRGRPEWAVEDARAAMGSSAWRAASAPVVSHGNLRLTVRLCPGLCPHESGRARSRASEDRVDRTIRRGVMGARVGSWRPRRDLGSSGPQALGGSTPPTRTTFGRRVQHHDTLEETRPA